MALLPDAASIRSWHLSPLTSHYSSFICFQPLEQCIVSRHTLREGVFTSSWVAFP